MLVCGLCDKQFASRDNRWRHQIYKCGMRADLGLGKLVDAWLGVKTAEDWLCDSIESYGEDSREANQARLAVLERTQAALSLELYADWRD